jgi:hypothetical protein
MDAEAIWAAEYVAVHRVPWWRPWKREQARREVRLAIWGEMVRRAMTDVTYSRLPNQFVTFAEVDAYARREARK